MTGLTRGYRAKLTQILNPEMPFEIRLMTEGSAEYDSCCFGLDAEEQLSDDRYMIFYNQTASPEGAVVMTAQGAAAVYQAELPKLPEQIAKLVFTVSIDGAQTMGGIVRHTVSLVQNGTVCAELSLTGADFHSERAIVDIEIYRKGEWRLNTVASGFDGGLPDLLRVFGGEEAEDAAASAPEPEPEPLPVPESEPERIQLGAKPVSLKKGQRVDLHKEGVPQLTKICVGLGWDAAKDEVGIDCDSSAFLCIGGKLKRHRDIVSVFHERHYTGAVVHSGDNLTGDGDGDDEQIRVDLQALPPEYDRIVFVANIFMGRIFRQHFGRIRNCFIRICDISLGELCRFDISQSSEYDGKTAMIFGELIRIADVWTFRAIGEGTNDSSISALARRFKK